jgi:hypothetical protein
MPRIHVYVEKGGHYCMAHDLVQALHGERMKFHFPSQIFIGLQSDDVK